MQARPILDPLVQEALGEEADSISSVEARLRRHYPQRSLITWEGDPQTFCFSAVVGDSEDILGLHATAWLEPGFWANEVVHPDDRGDAIAFCALATGRGSDHVFEYRALARDGHTVWLEDHVKVFLSPRGVAVLLRGVMFDVSAERGEAGAEASPSLYRPSRSELAEMAGDHESMG